MMRCSYVFCESKTTVVDVGIGSELLINYDEDRARHEAIELAEYWSRIDTEETKSTPGMASQTRVTTPTGDGSRAGRCDDRPALTPLIKP